MFYRNLKIGILGGGQLGRMLIQSAVNFNIAFDILDPDPEAPCKDLAKKFTVGSLTDYQTVLDFAQDLDLITIEIENVNVDALEALEKMGKIVYPQARVIRIIQDKRIQKQFYQDHHIPTAAFVLVDHKQDLPKHLGFLPAFLKLGKAGYDGKGVMAMNKEQDFAKAFDAPCVLESKISFEKELSVLVARNASGQVQTFPVVELVFNPKYNLVDYLFAPALIDADIEQKALALAEKTIVELDMVGLLAVELFLINEGDLLVNEIAPRPHNSGHHTIEANSTSQYEQHLRAILNLPLGATHTIRHAAMVNLLGEEGYNGLAKYEGLEEILKIEGVYPHLYGKKFTKPSRKMGHITICDQDKTSLDHKVAQVKKSIKVIA